MKLSELICEYVDLKIKGASYSEYESFEYNNLKKKRYEESLAALEFKIDYIVDQIENKTDQK